MVQIVWGTGCGIDRRAGHRPLQLGMNVVVNGEPREVAEGSTVALLLERLNLGSKPCAVEVNRGLVTRDLHAGRELKEGDVVEIVTLVGGG